MILFYNPIPIANMINIVEGIESKLMMDIHGRISIDITPLIEACDKSKPIILNFTKTDSEIKTMMEIKATGMPYPFFAPMLVIGPNNQTEGQMEPIGKDNKTMAQNTPTMNVQIGKCSACGADKIELIKVAGSKSVCANCFKLNMNLANMYADKKAQKGKKETKIDESKTGI